MILRAFIFIFCFVCAKSQAQEEIFKAVQLPPIDIFATDDKLTNDSVIKKLISDTSFYKSFLNMKYYPHVIDGYLQVYFKDDRDKARMERNAIQYLDNQYKWVQINNEVVTGKIRKKNGKYKYLTAEMYDEVFFPSSKQKVSPNIVSIEQEESNESKIDKYKSQLKKMLFNPGAPIESVPFIGNKMAIFSDDMVKFYDYKIYTSTCNDSSNCLIFSCNAKPEFGKNRTVIKRMTTVFDKETFEVLNRSYHLKYGNSIFQFDIEMDISNTQKYGYLVPEKIKYSGWWDIPLKTAEIIDFVLNCSDYPEISREWIYGNSENN